MIVRMWMTTDLVTVLPTTPITEAAKEMSRRKIRRLLVTDALRYKLLGVVTHYELARAFPPDLNPFAIGADTSRIPDTVEEIMTRAPLTVAPETPIEEAARLMRDNKIGALPVLLGQRLVGIITESDIFRTFINVMGVDKGGVRVTFVVSEEEDSVRLILDLAIKHELRVMSVLTVKRGQERLGVVRLHGAKTGAFVDELWKSGHKVQNVLRC